MASGDGTDTGAAIGAAAFGIRTIATSGGIAAGRSIAAMRIASPRATAPLIARSTPGMIATDRAVRSAPAAIRPPTGYRLHSRAGTIARPLLTLELSAQSRARP